MVFPFTAKAEFRKVFDFVPGPRQGVRRPLEEAAVRRVLYDCETRLVECKEAMRALCINLATPELAELANEIKNNWRGLDMLETRYRRLRAQHEQAIAIAKRYSFNFLEMSHP